MLLPFLILAGIAYLAFAASVIIKSGRSNGVRDAAAPHPATKVALAGGVPLVVAATMAFLFLVAGGATTVQLNVGSPLACL